MKKGTYKCKKCKGTGEIKNPNEPKAFIFHEHVKCPKCKGDGYLDWIENVVGKKRSEHEKRKMEIKQILKSGNWKFNP